LAGGPSIRLYRAPWSTNCERVALALALKGVEAQSVLIDYGDRRPVEAVSGQGLVPVIEDAGEVVADSVAIIRHLDRTRPDPPLFPADEARRAEVDVFIDWFEHVYKASPNAIEDELELEPRADVVEREAAAMAARLQVFERLLSGRDHLFGEFGAADCVAFPFLKYALARHPDDTEPFHLILDERQPLGDSHPRLRGWIERVADRPRAYSEP
jgi:glutathione S-transferase